jgi:hypothetical protein
MKVTVTRVDEFEIDDQILGDTDIVRSTGTSASVDGNMLYSPPLNLLFDKFQLDENGGLLNIHRKQFFSQGPRLFLIEVEKPLEDAVIIEDIPSKEENS